MGAELGRVCESALQFFGTMTASISHEINNVLAIINENAGLLTDFVLMADKGMPMDPERLKNLAEKINVQIQRADHIVSNMNKFAHSVDQSTKRIDLNELLELMVILSKRFAAMRGVTLEVTKQNNPVLITTHVLLLQNLLWLCLDFVMGSPVNDKTVILSAERGGAGALIRIAQQNGVNQEIETISSLLEKQDGLLEALKGELTTNQDEGTVILKLPQHINP